MQHSIAARLRSGSPIYAFLTIGLVATFLLLQGADVTGGAESHTLLEMIAALLALFAGLIAFIHYYTGHSSRFLFIGSGFIAAGFLDVYHTLVTSSWLARAVPSSLPSLTVWSWYPSRLLLAVLLFISWRAWDGGSKQTDATAWQEWMVHLIVGSLMALSFALFTFVRLPDAYRGSSLLGRPHELIPGLLFLIALLGYLRGGRWRKGPFERWIVVFLIFSVAIQFLFMAASRALYDVHFLAAHYLKIASYGSMLTGLLLSMYQVFRHGQQDARSLAALNQELEERVEVRTKALQDSEERFRALVQGAMDMITIVDGAGRITYDSPAVSRVLGYEPEERLGTHIVAYVHPDDIAEVRQTAGPALQHLGETVRVTVRMRHKNGSWRIVVASGTNMTHLPAVGGIVVNWHDITELKQAAEALDERNRVLNSILDSMDEGVIVAREDGTFAFYNRAAKRLLGAGPVDTGPDGWTASYNLLDPQKMVPMPTAELPLVRALQGEVVDDMDLCVQHPGSEQAILLSVSTRPFFDEHGEQDGALAVFSDITAERRAEQAIRQLNAELEERVRLRTAQLEAANDELEAFAYSVSHDLRTPLRAMDGFSRILLDDFAAALPSPAQRYLRRIRYNAQQMGALIDDLLAFSRLSRQPLKTELVQPVMLARQALDSLSSEQEGRQIEIDILPMPVVEADPRLLRVVFTNLLANALKYTRARDVAQLVVGVEQANGDLGERPVFFVRDNGVGFDMKYIDKLFGVFQRLHRAEEYEGTGVGLATVHRIIQRHGGQIWAEAEVDEGATFFFTIGEAH